MNVGLSMSWTNVRLYGDVESIWQIGGVFLCTSRRSRHEMLMIVNCLPPPIILHTPNTRSGIVATSGCEQQHTKKDFPSNPRASSSWSYCASVGFNMILIQVARLVVFSLRSPFLLECALLAHSPTESVYIRSHSTAPGSEPFYRLLRNGTQSAVFPAGSSQHQLLAHHPRTVFATPYITLSFQLSLLFPFSCCSSHQPEILSLCHYSFRWFRPSFRQCATCYDAPLSMSLSRRCRLHIVSSEQTLIMFDVRCGGGIVFFMHPPFASRLTVGKKKKL